MKERLKNEIKQLTEEELKKICNNLKEIFKGGVVVENPEKYQFSYEKILRKLNRRKKKWKQSTNTKKE